MGCLVTEHFGEVLVAHRLTHIDLLFETELVLQISDGRFFLDLVHGLLEKSAISTATLPRTTSDDRLALMGLLLR